MPTSEQKSELGIKKTSLYTKNTNKPIYSVKFLTEKQGDKHFRMYQIYQKNPFPMNKVFKEEKRFLDQKAKNLYYEDNNNDK